jgi:hypothetical protein
MKLFFILGSLVMLSAEKTCSNKTADGNYDQCFRGKLEIKANCMNYTISIIDGNMDTSLYVPSWKDENTGREYKNVFALGSKCKFPNTINEGDEFYFVIDSTTKQDCAVCMMYYPVPGKSLPIRIIQQSCADTAR